jgi:hypothetical protein
MFCSCNKSSKYPYAIKDFPEKLQPFLIKMVTEGIVMYRDSALRHMATNDDLIKLGKSEHPILRAAAFREMMDRKSFNHFEIIKEHLDDTALVFADAGEFGISKQLVSDDILDQATWQTEDAKVKTVEQVLSKHNYLRSAYVILMRLEPQEKYYPFIKNMATRPRRLDLSEGYELGFDDIEYALYGLAKFKKKEDIDVIKQKLMKHFWQLSDISFRLMKEYPDTAYLDVLQTYHHRQFYQFSGNRPHGFSGFAADRAAPEDFIQALVVQQNDRSAKLLDTMLMYLPKFKCMPDKENIIDGLITAIWANPCPAYAILREKIKPKAENILRSRISIPWDTTALLVDTSERIFRWYP